MDFISGSQCGVWELGHHRFLQVASVSGAPLQLCWGAFPLPLPAQANPQLSLSHVGQPHHRLGRLGSCAERSRTSGFLCF